MNHRFRLGEESQSKIGIDESSSAACAFGPKSWHELMSTPLGIARTTTYIICSTYVQARLCVDDGQKKKNVILGVRLLSRISSVDVVEYSCVKVTRTRVCKSV